MFLKALMPTWFAIAAVMRASVAQAPPAGGFFGVRVRLLGAFAASCLMLAGSVGWAQSSTYQFLHTDDPLQDRLAYILTVLETDVSARRALGANTDLERIRKRLDDSRNAARTACNLTDVKFCTLTGLALTDAEIESAGNALAQLARSHRPLSMLIHNHLRPSGHYQKHAALDDPAFLRAAWVDTAQGINRFFKIYLGENKSSREAFDLSKPQLFEPGTRRFFDHVNAVIDQSLDSASNELFFTPWAKFGIALLRINQRDDAARWEPLEEGENTAALARARTLDWSKYRYTAILVPGWGLDPAETGLAPGEAYTMRMAAKRWRDGVAPFIIFTGGQIHPDRTPYAPAIEAKRALMAQLRIPEDAILVDPYARHSTTDIRNAIRLLFRAGAPMQRPFLITSTQTQVAYMGGEVFAKRCIDERGFKIATMRERLSPFDQVAIPDLVSLSTDLLDPLDP